VEHLRFCYLAPGTKADTRVIRLTSRFLLGKRGNPLPGSIPGLLLPFLWGCLVSTDWATRFVRVESVCLS